MLTLSEVAREVGRLTGRSAPHISVVHRWRNRGISGHKLPTVGICGRLYVRRSDFVEFLRKTSDVKETPLPSNMPNSTAVIGHILRQKDYGQGGD